MDNPAIDRVSQDGPAAKFEQSRGPTLIQDLRFYSTTLNEPPDTKALLRRAADELTRLEALAAPVKCVNCEKVIERAAEWYRCFDCGSHLCENCCTNHFGHSAGGSYTPHHRKMEQYKFTIERLQRKIAEMGAVDLTT